MRSYINFSIPREMKTKMVLGLCSLLIPFAMSAQQAEKDSALIRTVVVEQEYNPNVMDASKINILPEVEEPSVVKRDIEYSNTLIPATSYGAYQELLPFTQQETQPNAKRGYARLGYGNRGNVDAKLSYLYDFSSKDKISFDFSLDGWNEKLSSPFEDIEKWKYRYYRTKFLVDYLHRFEKTELSIAGSFESDVFSYQDFEYENVVPSPLYETGLRQHHTKGFAGVALSSRHEDMPLRFNLHADYLFFDKKYIMKEKYEDPKNRENIFRIYGDIQGDISDEQIIGLNVKMNNVFYTLEDIKNYSTLDLKPYYLHEGDSWKAKLGVNVDLGFGHGKSFLVSPDVEGQYNFSDDYLVYLNMKGGRILNDYRHIELLSPYAWPGQSILQQYLESTYVPLDVSLGIKGSPVNGLWFNLFGGYQIRKDDLCPSSLYNMLFIEIYDYFKVTKTKALYLGGAIDYTYKDLFKFSFNANYYNWSADDEIGLLLKPEFEIKADMDFRIMKGLFFNIGYNYIKRPEVNLYMLNPISFIETPVGYHRMEAINNLSAQASYYFTNNLSVFVKGNNLLNKDYQYYYSYPAQKISVMGGVSFRF